MNNLRAELQKLADGVGPAAGHALHALSGGAASARLREAIRALAVGRGPASSTCPSDAARAVGGDGWRDLMPAARDIARQLAQSGEVEITQGGDVVDPHGEWKGPIRIRVSGSADIHGQPEVG